MRVLFRLMPDLAGVKCGDGLATDRGGWSDARTGAECRLALASSADRVRCSLIFLTWREVEACPGAGARGTASALCGLSQDISYGLTGPLTGLATRRPLVGRSRRRPAALGSSSPYPAHLARLSGLKSL